MAAKKKAKKTQEMLLVSSKTKAALKEMDVNVAGDALDALNGLVYWHVEQAANRANANGRKTVRGHDFVIM
jgi:histone H3/H4